MKKKFKLLYMNTKGFYIYPIILGSLIYLIIRLVTDSISEKGLWERDWLTNLTELLLVILMGYILIYHLFKLESKFNKKLQKEVNRKLIINELWQVYWTSTLWINAIGLPILIFLDDGFQWADWVVLNIVPPLVILIFFLFRRSGFYLDQYVDSQVAITQIEKEKVETELQFLRAQLQPHFLFNALNTIYFQMEDSVTDAQESLEKFSSLLRYQLYDHKKGKIALSEELKYLKSFIAIQSLRQQKDLELEQTFDPALSSYKIYPFLMLPLVENAFKYVGGEKKIHISASLKNQQLHFTCWNTKMNPMPPPQKSASGIGLDNLKKRLALLYPEQHQLTIKDTPVYFEAELWVQLEQ